jgi:hypothetical protein
MDPYRLHCQAQTVDRNIVVSIEIDDNLIELDEAGIEVRLSSKIEKGVRYLYDRGYHLTTFLKQPVYGDSHTY